MTLSLLANDMMNSPQLSRSNMGGVSVFRYGPFGSSRPAGAVANILGFNGQRRDPVSDSYHLGNGYRAYNPTLMRFNCPDNLSPFGAGGINPYTYCLGDPVNRADPSGHISWQAGIGIGLGILGIIATAGAAAMAISVAGGIGAALSAASSATLLTGGVGVAADVVGIASGAVSESNPELSATLGWVSMGAGLIGAGAGAIGAKSAKGAININNPKPALHYKAFDIATISRTSSGKRIEVVAFDGYVNDFRGTRAPGIILHGTKKGGFSFNHGIENLSYLGQSTPTAITRFSSAEELARGLESQFSLNLKGSETPLYVVSCYARRSEKALAAAFERPIYTFSTNKVYATAIKNYLGESSTAVRNRAFIPLKPKLYTP